MKTEGIVEVKQGARINLKAIDPAAKAAASKDAACNRLKKLQERFADLQVTFFAEHQRSFLLVLQAMDTGGKDGAVKAICHGIDPNGIRLSNFKYPSPEEWDHDFLWRVHKVTPAKGMIAIWNRSHYEDVLVPRVHDQIKEEVWRKRCEDIVAFERLLRHNGTTILKFFLHISKEEQKERLQARLDKPDKHWKFNPGDLKERALWDRYMEVNAEVMAATSTPGAPWRIVPANRKWSRDLFLLETIVGAMEKLRPRFPTPDFDPAKIKIV